MRLFHLAACPYAQRTRALLAIINQQYEDVEIDAANKPADFLALSPTGKVPLLDDEGFVLYESQIINEYLAERFGWASAFSGDVKQRARERLAMKQFDEVLVPTFFAGLRDPGAYGRSASWEREVDFAAGTVVRTQPLSLLGLHMATHWQRMTWVSPESPLILRARSNALGSFLDAAAALPTVVSTAPERESTVRLLLARFGPSAT